MSGDVQAKLAAFSNPTELNSFFSIPKRELNTYNVHIYPSAICGITFVKYNIERKKPFPYTPDVNIVANNNESIKTTIPQQSQTLNNIINELGKLVAFNVK